MTGIFGREDELFSRTVAIRKAGHAHRREDAASHQQKRTLIYKLGVGCDPVTLAAYISTKSDGSLDVREIPNAPFAVIVRERNRPAFRRGTTMEEAGDPDMLPPGHVLLSDDDFLTIEHDKSVVVISPEPDGDVPFTVELVVLRNVAADSRDSPALYRWLVSVVDQAVDERRDVRPPSEGKLVQTGLNLGPRHARVIGWAKSFTRKLSPDDMIAHDEDVIGAASLMWAIMQSILPTEVIGPIEAGMDHDWMPSIATRNVPAGDGYKIAVNGRIYAFPAAKRGPPTTYLSRGYSAKTHIDRSLYSWCISWTVAREIQNTAVQAGDKRSAGDMCSGPPGGGANFVDVTLGIIVKNAARTAMAFRPGYQHGTTACHGAINRGLTNNFDEAPGKALLELRNSGKSWGITHRGQVLEIPMMLIC
ncbi:hypothetical protein BD626DRAFT_499509, partial [Schizophyllum amplum]